MPFLILLLVIASIPFLVVWVASRRRKGMAADAARRGWLFAPEAPGYAERYPDHALFRNQHNRTVLNVMTGTADGLPVEVFDYTYTAGSSQSSRKTIHTVVHVHLPSVNLPPFSLYPETRAERLVATLGFQDVDLPGQPAFSDVFVLTGPDEEALRAYFAGPLADVLATYPGLSVDGTGAHLFIYRARRQPSADRLQALIVEATGVARAVLVTEPS